MRGEHAPADVEATLNKARANAGVDTSAIWNPNSVGAGGAGYAWAPREESWFRSVAPPKAREPYDCSHEYADEGKRGGTSAANAPVSGNRIRERRGRAHAARIRVQARGRGGVLRCVKQSARKKTPL